MPVINSRTLVFAIQAIDREIRLVRSGLESGESTAEDYELLEKLNEAAEDLERAYSVTAQDELNLPPYAELVKP